MASQENRIVHTRVLVVFACPEGSDSLRLAAEDRAIRQCIDLSRHRGKISREVLHAASITDVRRALLDSGFRIVHFSGHATGRGLVLEDEKGRPQPIPQDALADLLSAHSPPIECVILNACYTDIQAHLISLGVPFAVAMSGEISDAAAIEFSRGFYDAIGAGRDFEFAFQEGHRAVRLMNLADGFLPLLLTERRPPGDTQVKIVSQLQVKVEEEEGFLDYILGGLEGFQRVTEVLGRITDRITSLGGAMQDDAAELKSVGTGGDRSSLAESRRIIDRSAETMDSFARELDEEASSYRDAYSIGVRYYGKATTILAADFDTDCADQIREALSVLRSLRESTTLGRTGFAGLRESISAMPRMTKKLNHAKRRCLAAIDRFDQELEAGLEQTMEVEASVENLLHQQTG